MNNNQILIVDTDVSSLDSTLERIVQGAGNLPSSVISVAMEEEADTIFAEVYSITGIMRANSVSSLREGNLDQFLVRFESLIDDVKRCMRLFNAWRRKYRTDPNANLRNEVESELKNMEDTFLAYRNAIAEKRNPSKSVLLPLLLLVLLLADLLTRSYAIFRLSREALQTFSSTPRRFGLRVL